MIVAVEGFGSIWSVRNGSSAFYNTTGVLVNGRARHHSRVFGQIRFNAIGGFNPQHIESNIGRVFASPGFPGADHCCVLLRHMLSRPQSPDFYIFAVSSECTGKLPVDDNGWKADGVVLLSLSQFREEQEAMLFMPAHSWIRCGLGRFVVESVDEQPWRASLVLKGH